MLRASKCGERALRVDPSHAETLSELSRLLARTDRLAEAAGLAERLGELPGWEARGAARLGADPGRAVGSGRRRRGRCNVPSALIRQCTSRTSRPWRFGSDWLVPCSGSVGPTRPKPFFGPFSNLGLTGRPNGCSVASHSNVATAPRPWPPGRAPRAPARSCPSEPAPYVGSRRCAECHGEVNDIQQSSRHAQTFHYADEVAALHLPSQTYIDPKDPQVISTVTPDTKQAILEVAAGPEVIRAVMEYVLGSGRHAFTPIGRDDEGVLRELRLTYYAAISSWDLTPGHPLRPRDWHGFLGERQTDDSLRRCLSCHTTNPRAAIAKTGPEAADRGIGCERCHGPGGNHVAAVEASFPDFAIGTFRRTSSGSSPRVMNLCGECHGTRAARFSRTLPRRPSGSRRRP